VPGVSREAHEPGVCLRIKPGPLPFCTTTRPALFGEIGSAPQCANSGPAESLGRRWGNCRNCSDGEGNNGALQAIKISLLERFHWVGGSGAHSDRGNTPPHHSVRTFVQKSTSKMSPIYVSFPTVSKVARFGTFCASNFLSPVSKKN